MARPDQLRAPATLTRRWQQPLPGLACDRQMPIPRYSDVLEWPPDDPAALILGVGRTIAQLDATTGNLIATQATRGVVQAIAGDPIRNRLIIATDQGIECHPVVR